MTTETKSAGELCRDDLERLFGERYPDRLNRQGILGADIDWSKHWVDTQIDNALHTLKKRCIITLDSDGYQLRTAPDSYNAQLLAGRNASGEQAPEAVKVSPMDEKPINATLRNPTRTFDPVVKMSNCKNCKTGLVDTKGKCTEFNCSSNVKSRGSTSADRIGDDGWPKTLDHLKPTPAPICPEPLLADLDPVAVRNALADLNARLTLDRVDMALKLEVLDYLGRILDDSIEKVLKSIAGDLTKPSNAPRRGQENTNE